MIALLATCVAAAFVADKAEQECLDVGQKVAFQSMSSGWDIWIAASYRGTLKVEPIKGYDPKDVDDLDRWAISFEFKDAKDLHGKLASLEARVYFHLTVEEYDEVDLSKKQPQPNRLGAGEFEKAVRGELRLVMEDGEKSKPVRRLAEILNVKGECNEATVILSHKVRAEMQKLELAHQNRTKEEIQKKGMVTFFRITWKDDKWSVEVVKQVER